MMRRKCKTCGTYRPAGQFARGWFFCNGACLADDPVLTRAEMLAAVDTRPTGPLLGAEPTSSCEAPS